MPVVSFAQLPGLIAEDVRKAREEAAVLVVGASLDALNRSAPRVTGNFAASFEPFRGDDQQGSYSESNTAPKGEMDARSALQGLEPGEVFGVGTAHPGANKLVFHGLSKKVSKDWFDTSVRHAVREAEGRQS